MVQVSEHVKSCPAASKSINLHYNIVYGHQTLQAGNFSLGAPIHKVAQPFDHVFLRDPSFMQSCEVM